jgi:serine/threonine protein kinase
MYNATLIIVVAAVIIVTVPAVIAIVQAIHKLRRRKAQNAPKAEPVKNTSYPVNGRYDVKSQPFKQGGMATIWTATERKTGKTFIIKTPRRGTTLDNVYLDKLMLEAGYLKKLSHPGIVKYIEDFYYNGEFHVVMEFLNGETLMSSSPRMSPGEQTVVSWACQLLDVLAYIHDAGIIHRDINPKNILLCNDGPVKLIDFGTAKDLREREDKTKISGDPFTQIANKGFDIPELFMGGDSDGRCDLCGLAQTCIYLLTLRHPNEICTSLLKSNWPRTYSEAGVVSNFLIASGINKRTARCLAQAIMFSPDKRFADARSMLAALSSTIGGPVKPLEAAVQK